MWPITPYLVIGHAPSYPAWPLLSFPSRLTWSSHHKGTFVTDISTTSSAVSAVSPTRRPREANNSLSNQDKTLRTGVPRNASSRDNLAWDGRFRLPDRNIPH